MLKLRLGPLTYELVRSGPMELEQCRVVLVARVLSLKRRAATVAWRNVAGWGIQATSVAPVAVLEERGGLRRLKPIVDLNKLFTWALAGACIATIPAVWSAQRALEHRRTEGG